MLYISLTILAVSFLIPCTFADCSDEALYCFDSNDKNLGEIIVGSCWKWGRLSCQACSADTSAKKITYLKYLNYCRHLYPGSVQVLNTKTVWANRLRDALNELAIG